MEGDAVMGEVEVPVEGNAVVDEVMADLVENVVEEGVVPAAEGIPDDVNVMVLAINP